MSEQNNKSMETMANNNYIIETQKLNRHSDSQLNKTFKVSCKIPQKRETYRDNKLRAQYKLIRRSYYEFFNSSTISSNVEKCMSSNCFR